MPAQDHVRVAVVGYGYWGAKHVRILSSLPGVAVRIVDADPGRLAEAAAHYPAAERSSDLGEALDRVDAVVVATPPGSHVAVARRALEAGLPTLVEKPLADSVQGARLLVDTAAAHGAVLMVGHTFEYNPAVWKLKELVASGSLGKILYVDSARLSLGRYQRDVDVVWDLAPHDISIASFVLGVMPDAVSVWAERHIDSRQADLAYLRLDFDDPRTHAFIRVSWLNPDKVRRVTVVGDRKMAVYDDLSDNERVRVYDIGVDVRTIDDPTAAHGLPVTYRTGDIVSPYIPFDEPLLIQDSHFLECVRTGQESRTPGTRGLDVVRVLAAADAAHAGSRTVAVNGRPRLAHVAPELDPSIPMARMAVAPTAARRLR